MECICFYRLRVLMGVITFICDNRYFVQLLRILKDLDVCVAVGK